MKLLRSPGRATLIAGAFLAAGCAGPGLDAPPEGTALDVNWSNPHYCALAIDRSGIQPTNLSFMAGEAAVLALRNESPDPQSFAADAFFANIAPWKVVSIEPGPDVPMSCGTFMLQRMPGDVSETASLDVPSITSINLDPGETKLLYFVPLQIGVYGVECTSQGEVSCSAVDSITVIRPQTSS